MTKNILGFINEKDPGSLVVGKIYEKKEGQYYIRDKKNRTHVASSFTTYSVGTTVVVRKGFILNTVSDFKSIPAFVV
jgi:hypothetical protein